MQAKKLRGLWEHRTPTFMTQIVSIHYSPHGIQRLARYSHSCVATRSPSSTKQTEPKQTLISEIMPKIG